MRTVLALLLLPGCAPGEVRPGVPDETPTTPGDDARAEVVETFTYEAPKLDMAFLLDPSSVEHMPGDFLTSLGPFVDALEARGVHYRLGVASSEYVHWADEGNGRLVQVSGLRWVGPEHPAPADWLRAAALAVEEASSDESATLAALRLVEQDAPGLPNFGFLRHGSELQFLYFGWQPDDASVAGVSQEHFLDAMAEVRPEPGRLGFHVITDRDLELHASQHDFGEILAAWGGRSHDIDEPPFLPMMRATVDTIERTNVFPLSEPPDPTTLEGTLFQSERTFQLDAEQLRFDPVEQTVSLGDLVPEDGATVEIRYVPAER